MRPQFNSFPPQPRPQRQQQQQHQQNNGHHNHHQHNGYQNPINSNQVGMMTPHMMSNPMMGHMNNPIPIQNMPPINPQFFNNLSNMPQHQQQEQLHQFGLPNHINQLIPNLLGSLQFAVANNNLMGNHSLPLVQPNFFQPSQPQLNSFNSLPYSPVPPTHQNHQLQPPGFSEPRPQVHSGNVNNTNGSNSKGNDFRNKYTKQQKFKGPGKGFHRSQSHQADNAKNKFGSNKDHMGKGKCNKIATELDGSDGGNIAKEKKRSYVLTYTAKEIQQWRQARRKNFPTKLNVEKKLKKNDPNCNFDDEAKRRRQQLREVLAKQAELGVEVAEVPSHYLSNTDEQVNVNRGDNNGQLQNKDGKKGRFRQNKRRHGENDKFGKRQKFQDKNSSQESSMKTRNPTLLEMLLSADIKRDKSQLLQVFRFMVMNSFFKEFPEQPLQLPLVIVEETGCEHAEEDLSDDDDDDDVDVNGDANSCDKAFD